jgi:hypothetical protein
MIDKLSIYIKNQLKDQERSIRWMARQMSISSVHLGAIINGKQSWTPNVLRQAAKALQIPLIQAYIMAGVISDADLKEYSIEQSLGDELVELLAKPGVREICHRIKRLLNTYPQYLDKIIPDLIRELDKEMAVCKMRLLDEKEKHKE